MYSVSIVFVPLLFFLACPISAKNEWVEHFAYIDSDITMNCSVSENNTAKWYLPNGQPVKTSDHYQLEGNLLHIKKVSSKDSGLYTCKVNEINGTLNQIHTLNIGGPMYYSLSEKYYWNIVTAVVASIIVCFVFVSLILIYKFRYRNPKLLRIPDNNFGSDTSQDTKLWW